MRWVVVWLALAGCSGDAPPPAGSIDAAIDAPDAPWPFPYQECRDSSDCDPSKPVCCLYCGHFNNCGPSMCMAQQDSYCSVRLCDPDAHTCNCQLSQVDRPGQSSVPIYKCRP